MALALLLAAGFALAAFHSGDRHGRLDPRSADRYDSRAVAQLLTERGVALQVTTRLDGALARTGPHTTLLVTSPDLLTPGRQHRLRDATEGAAGRTVLLAAGPSSVGALAPGVRTANTVPVTTRDPGCSLPAARTAGPARTGGLRYASDASDGSNTVDCYPGDGLPTLLHVKEKRAGDTVLAGAPDFLSNDHLADQGNASLALRLLGSRPHLVWYLPSLTDTSSAGNGDDPGGGGAEGERSFADLIPPGWLWGTLNSPSPPCSPPSGGPAAWVP